MEEAIQLQRHDGGAAAGVSGGEGVLVVGGAGRGAAGVGAGPAGCAVSEYDGGGVEEECDGACG